MVAYFFRVAQAGDEPGDLLLLSYFLSQAATNTSLYCTPSRPFSLDKNEKDFHVSDLMVHIASQKVRLPQPLTVQ